MRFGVRPDFDLALKIDIFARERPFLSELPSASDSEPTSPRAIEVALKGSEVTGQGQAESV